MEIVNVLLRAVSILAAILVVGTAGFCWIEHWSVFDSLYMTVITMTTTGFKEVHSLSDGGRLFTMALLFVSILFIGYLSTQVLNEFLNNVKNRGRARMDKRIAQMKNHTIVLGFGRMGQSVCAQFKEAKHPFIVIEKEERLLEALDKSGHLYLKGDAADDDNLRVARIEHAKHLVCVIDNESDGLFAAVAARSLNPKIRIVVRADHESTRKKMLLAGADEVVLPFLLSGRKVAQKILQPNVEDFLELGGADGRDQQRLEIFDIFVSEHPQLKAKSLRSCGLRREGLIVVGLRRPGGQFLFAPDADTKFADGDCLVALGTSERLADAMKHLREQVA